MTVILHLEIQRCSDCPYNRHVRYDDVGTDFGMSYYCRHPAMPNKDVVRHGHGVVDRQVGRTLKEVARGIRKLCPLRNPTKETA